MAGVRDSDFSASFQVSQFRPTRVKSPLNPVKFIVDSDSILFDPSRSEPADDLVSFSTVALPSTAAGMHLPSQYQSGQALSGQVPDQESMQDVKIQLAGPRKYLYYDPQVTNAAIVTCGGVAPGLNNVVRSLVNILLYRYRINKVYGCKFGFKGLVKSTSRMVELTPEMVKDIHQFGGTFLGSSRGPQNPDAMADFLIDSNISILFCIGGDGTQKGAHSIAKSLEKKMANISVIGIGKTIDNDLLFVDRSFGFDTAVQQSQHAIVAAHEEARSTENGIGIVKLMGRESGAIALYASLASGDVNVVLLPEVSFTVEKLCDYIAERFKTKDHCLIVVAEGAGYDLVPPTGRSDASGNKVLPDVGHFLKKEIAVNLKQRGVSHSVKYIDPSYTIRGGVANASDAVLCTLYAQMAAHAGMAGKTDMMVGLLHGHFVHLPLERVTEGKKNVDIKGTYWQSFLDATGSPFVD